MYKKQYEVISIADFKPYLKNARKHPQKQLRKLENSLRKFGPVNPIVVDEDGVIIAGHGRLQAAKKIGLRNFPAIRVEGLSTEEKTALRIADNRIADESTFDKKVLAVELQSLIELDCDLEMTGFDAIELDPILAIDAEGEPEPPFPALSKQAVSRHGDLWLCGEHRLLCADARDPSAYKQLLGGELAGMVFTDPPYNVRIDGHVAEKGKARHSEFQMASGEMSDDEFRRFLAVALGNMHAFSADGSIHYACMDWRHIDDLLGVGRGIYSKLLNLVVWAKPNGGMGSFYRSQHELVAVFKKGTAAHINNVQLGRLGRYRSNVWQYPGASSFSKTRKQDLDDHPTVKPIAMVADAILDASRPGDLILDPFGGAGTTLLAAQRTGRRAALLEIDPLYVDVTLRRFREATGVEALLMPERIPFSEVTEDRKHPGKDER